MALMPNFTFLEDVNTIGPFIRGKIRREVYYLYEHVLFNTRTARINGSRLISVLDSFSCECCPYVRRVLFFLV